MGLLSRICGAREKDGIVRETLMKAVLSVISFLSILVVPFFGMILGLFTPLPSLLSVYRKGWPAGCWAPGLAAGLGTAVLAFLGLVQIAPYFLLMLSLGILLGFGMRQQWSVEKTIAVPSLLIFGASGLLLWFSYDGAASGFMKFVEQDMKGAVDAAIQHYGPDGPEQKLLEETLYGMIPVLVRLLPGVAFSSALVASWLNVVGAKRFTKVVNQPFPAWGEWLQWKTPDHLVWLVIASGGCLLAPVPLLKSIGLNLLVVVGTIYLFQGLAIAGFFFERWKLPRILRALFYACFLLQQFATLGVALVGLFDLWFDFRRLTRKPASQNQ